MDKEEIIENNITKVIKSSDDVEMKKITLEDIFILAMKSFLN